MTEAAPRRPNRLAQETSPYLLQHADNPVDWYPWGEEALARARREQRPILLSVGYSACHWCHVMERESFADPSIAAVMNESFVCIKVDREERPDVDELYLTAAVALNGSAGWPLTVFLTPDQEPFFAGTYFPPTGSDGRPGFVELLRRIAELWRHQRGALLDQARQLTAHVIAAARPSLPQEVSASAIDVAVAALERVFDPEHGGFGGPPKFPPAAALSLLLRHHRSSGQQRSLTMVLRTLDAMKSGGIYDQLGGGFARYATDGAWLVPHFEKMLYDNAQLARVYLEAFAVTSEPEYARVATETLDFVLRELQDPAGGLWSALDADSEGEEGRYYLWNRAEVEATLGAAAAAAFGAYYDVSAPGNWEGRSILRTPRPLGLVAAELGVSPEALLATLASARAELLVLRQRRVRPRSDDKVLTSWNGLAIGALAEGARVLGHRRFREGALRAARFAMDHLRRPDGGLFRTWRAGSARLDAYLEDYAYLGDGLLDLYEATGERSCFEVSAQLAERLVADFADPAHGGFLATAIGHQPLLARLREGHDGALPSANAVAARLLARLSWHLDRPDHRLWAVRALRAHGHAIERAPRAFATALSVADLLLEGPLEVVLTGAADDPAREELSRALGRRYLPNRVVAHALPAAADRAASSGLLAGRVGLGTASVQLCYDRVCHPPVCDAGTLREALDEAERRQLLHRATLVASPPLAGRATPAATAQYFARLAPAVHPRRFGREGPLVSALGIGASRLVEASEEHRAALREALRGGINLVDTAAHHGDGTGEILVGQVLAELVASGALARDEVVVVSRVGSLSGRALDEARERAAAGAPWPEVVPVDDGVWHCLHPEFLEAALTQTLGRLGLASLDLLLLHEPESFLREAAGREPTALDAHREVLYARLEAAFRHLEGEVTRGRIGAYGISSSALSVAGSAPARLDLERLMAIAKQVGGERHACRGVALPTNLLEPTAIGADGLIAAAARWDLGVLVVRPLTAVIGPGLLRLVERPATDDEPSLVTTRLADLALLEAEFRDSFAPRLAAGEGGAPPAELFDWGRRLDAALEQVASYEQWVELEQQAVRPHTRRVLDALDRLFTGALRARWLSWRGGYVVQLEATLEALGARAAEASRARLAPVRTALAELLPGERRSEPLARLALWSATSLPGVTSVLVGARRPDQVAELRLLLDWEPLPDAERVFFAASRAVSR